MDAESEWSPQGIYPKRRHTAERGATCLQHWDSGDTWEL